MLFGSVAQPHMWGSPGTAPPKKKFQKEMQNMEKYIDEYIVYIFEYKYIKIKLAENKR